MNVRNLNNYYIWGMKALIFVIPFLSFWIAKSMFFPYITARNFAFRILVEIALALWIGLIILNKEYRPRFSPIVIAILVFAGVIGLANFFGVDPYHSFWSRLERMEGYLMILHLAAYFLILITVFRTKKEWLAFFNAVLLAGILVGGYGVLQVLGLKEAIQGGDVRIDGTIGNPTYLAIYLTLVIAITLILLFNAVKSGWRWFYGAAAAFFFFVLFFTASRGATLSLIISTPLFLVLYLMFSGKYKKLAIFSLVLIFALPLIFWTLKDTKFVQNSEVLSRFASISLGEKTIKARFIIWNMALRAFKENPVLGWGQENFLYAFSKYYDPRMYDQEPWFDRPHNIIFEWLINGGILGLASYLGIFAALFWGIRKIAVRKLAPTNENIVLIVAPVAYFLQNIFVFDNFNTYILFFALLGYAHSLVQQDQSVSVAPNTVIQEKSASRSLAGLLAASLIMLPIIYFVNYKPSLAAKGIIEGLQSTASSVDPVEKTLKRFKTTIELNTFADNEVLEQLARVADLLISQESIADNLKAPFLQYSITQMENYLKKFPGAIRLHLMIAALYQEASRFSPNFIFKARDHLKIALSLSPKKQQILFVVADNYLKTAELNKAIELLEEAVELEFTYRDAHINLATVGIYSGQENVVRQSIKNLDEVRKLKFDKNHPDHSLWDYIVDLSKIGDAYLRIENREGARSIYNRILALEPEVAKYGVGLDSYQNLLKKFD
ncbi:MAG: O-antigen ligase family protein [Patescibacteria group bacterium]